MHRHSPPADIDDQPSPPRRHLAQAPGRASAGGHHEKEISELAELQHGVVTVQQLRELGVSPGRRRAQIAARRWMQLPHRAVLVGGGRGTDWAAWWTALAEVGKPAALGGVTALMADGLSGYDEDVIHVWLPKSSRVTRPSGVRVHETRRWGPDDHAPHGIPRARPAVATVQAALWAVSHRQAVLTLVMPIQQRLTRAQDVAEVLDRVKRHRFRSCLRLALGDIADGAHSMNELDFARICRDYGLPEPSRQVVREGANGADLPRRGVGAIPRLRGDQWRWACAGGPAAQGQLPDDRPPAAGRDCHRAVRPHPAGRS